MAADTGWYQTRHCNNCDGTGRAYYASEYKKTCLDCNGSGTHQVWVTKDSLAQEEEYRRKTEEKNRAEAEQYRINQQTLKEQRAKAKAQAFVIQLVVILGLLVAVLMFLSANPKIGGVVVFVGIFLLIGFIMSIR